MSASNRPEPIRRPASAAPRDGYHGEVAACRRKASFGNARGATKYAALVREKEGYARSYHCPACGRWHVTHQTVEENAAMQALPRGARRHMRTYARTNAAKNNLRDAQDCA